jgi:hypothetical protein
MMLVSIDGAAANRTERRRRLACSQHEFRSHAGSRHLEINSPGVEIITYLPTPASALQPRAVLDQPA